jgi:prophage DNA circulation protein
MTWKSGLRRASFRGVRFDGVEERELEGGRRIQNHQFPKRDSNFPEDMGMATREFSVDAYLIGDDYMSRRDRLIAACEKKGAGTYVDFWGRSQRVVCPRFRLIEENQEGRMCRFRLDFLADGGAAAQAPISYAATAVQLASSAASLISAATSRFSSKFER